MYRNEIQKQWLIMSNNCQRTPNGQSKMGNPEKLATQGTKTKKNKTKAQYNMCRTSLYVNKHKQQRRKKSNISLPTNNQKQHEPSHKQPEAT